MNFLPIRFRRRRPSTPTPAMQRAIDAVYRRSVIGSLALIAATKLAKDVMDGTARKDDAEAVLRLIAEMNEKPGQKEGCTPADV